MFFRVVIFLVAFFFLNSCASKKNVNNSNRQPKAGFSEKLGCPLPENNNQVFIEAIAEWVNVQYRYGGNSKKGTDCSGFVQAIYKSVFNKILDHNAFQISKKARRVNKNQLAQGDLLFFKINKKQVDHVGLHIYDTYFIHASTKKGVIVSDLKQAYYQQTFDFYGKID